MKYLSLLLSPAALLVFALPGVAAPQDDTPKPKPEQADAKDGEQEKKGLSEAYKKIIDVQSRTYPLKKCLISGEALKDPVVIVHDGRMVRLCCGMCVDVFKADAKKFLKELDDAVVKAQIGAYPLTKCLVSDKRLGAETVPVEYVHGTRLVRLGDAKAVEIFLKDPAKYHAELDKHYMARQQWDYPLDYCPISNNKLDDKAVDVVYGNTLIKLCCTDCKKAFKEKALFCSLKVRNARTKLQARRR